MIAPLSGFFNLFNTKSISHEEFAEIAPILEENTDQIQLMFSNLFNWAESQKDGFTLSKQEVKIQDVFETIQNTFSQKCLNEKLTFRIKPCTDLNKTVFANPEHLRQIFRNLVHNAIKFTPNGGEIELGCEETPSGAQLYVSDTGVGMDDDAIERLTVKLERFTKNGTRNEKGTGFGLQVCQTFLDLNRTKLQVDSELGKGSKFYFYL